MKKTYKIDLSGCDDNTIFEIELTQEEYNLLKLVSDKSEQVSTYGCMPTLSIEEVLPQAIESDESAQASAGGRIGGCHE